jgi:hypothetical protein
MILLAKFDFLPALLAVFKAKFENFFYVREAFFVGLTLSMRFWNQWATGYIESIRCFPYDNGIFHTPHPQAQL